MRMQRHLAVALLALALPAAAAPLDDLIRALEPHMPVDTQRLERAAVEGALHAIDPHAAFVPVAPPEATNTPPHLLAASEYWPEDLVRFTVHALHDGQDHEVQAMRDGLTPSPSGVVLDLRGAGGDSLDTLDAIGGIFYTNDTPLYALRDGHGNTLTSHYARAATPPPPLPPVMVLIDGDTRGVSETLAALLGGHAGVMLLGTPTRGDSARRTRIPWSEEEDLLIGTSWIVPISGADYFPHGVTPHILIANLPPPAATSAAPATVAATDITNAPPAAGFISVTNAASAIAARVGDDLVLRRAVDILLGLRALRAP